MNKINYNLKSRKYGLGGNIISTIGSAASTFNPFLGLGISTGANLIDNLFSLNKENINTIEKENELLGSTTIDSSSNDSILSQWNNQNFGTSFSLSDIGKGPLAKTTYNNLMEDRNKAINKLLHSYSSAIENSNKNSNLDILANFSAFGGLLDIDNNEFSEGGKIHIKPENRGKFTALKKRTGKSASWFKEHGTPAQRKMATFALNARKWKHSNGGPLLTHGGIFSNGVTTINNGGTHEENPYEGIQLGVDSKGVPNLVEEGEVIWNDYVFSNRLSPTKDMKKQNRYKGKTFADIAKNLQKESEERPNDPISKRGLNAAMQKLQLHQEQLRGEKNLPSESNVYADGSWLRYAPVVGSGLSSIVSLFEKPDYTNAELVGNSVNSLPVIEFNPLSNYLTYKPLDTDYYINKLSSQAGATRRAINDQSGGNRGAAMAGLLALDYNTQGRLGDLMRQGEEYNMTQRERVAGFNRQTDMFNSEGLLKTALANRQNNELKLKAKMAEAELREQADNRLSSVRSANLTNLFDSLGNIGIDEANKSDRNLLIAKSVLKGLSEEEKASLGIKSYGGKLRNKRKGLTY